MNFNFYEYLIAILYSLTQQMQKQHERDILEVIVRWRRHTDGFCGTFDSLNLSLELNTSLWILQWAATGGFVTEEQEAGYSLRHSLAESPVALAQGLSW